MCLGYVSWQRERYIGSPRFTYGYKKIKYFGNSMLYNTQWLFIAYQIPFTSAIWVFCNQVPPSLSKYLNSHVSHVYLTYLVKKPLLLIVLHVPPSLSASCLCSYSFLHENTSVCHSVSHYPSPSPHSASRNSSHPSNPVSSSISSFKLFLCL